MSDQATSDGSIRDRLLNLHRLAESAIRSAVVHRQADIGYVLRLDLDIRMWADGISTRPEAQQLHDARRELGFATFAASAGLYRLAYGGLRLFLELSFAAVYFSANELHRRQWVSDRADFSWSKALDENDAVLSSAFVREFLPESAVDAPQYAALAASCYRHCSQFVHGKLAATSRLPNDLAFSDEILADWTATARLAAESVLYLLYCRYSADLLETYPKLQSTLDPFAHLKSVRAVLGLPIEFEETNG